MTARRQTANSAQASSILTMHLTRFITTALSLLLVTGVFATSAGTVLVEPSLELTTQAMSLSATVSHTKSDINRMKAKLIGAVDNATNRSLDIAMVVSKELQFSCDKLLTNLKALEESRNANITLGGDDIPLPSHFCEIISIIKSILLLSSQIKSAIENQSSGTSTTEDTILAILTAIAQTLPTVIALVASIVFGL
ncbi:hypothetical protein ACGC1H_005307 [Rhizoctonia solani]